jgi:cyanophycinase-like exopeptidase
LGGDTLNLNSFLKEYELSDLIRKNKAVVMGASAGAINMSAKWLCSEHFGYEVEISTVYVYDGISLGNFSVLSHFDLENNLAVVQKELSSLSEEIDIYASNKDCAVRVKEDKVDIFGDVYLISHSNIQKLEETL